MIVDSKKKLTKNYIYTLTSQIITMIIPLLTSPYLARVLTAEGTGQYSFSYSIITYFCMFAQMGFFVYGQREIARKRDNLIEKSTFFWEIIILRTLFTFVSLVVLFFILQFDVFDSKYANLITIMSIHVISVIFDLTFFYQGIEDFKAIAIRTIIIKVLGTILIFIFVKQKEDLWKYVLCGSLTVFFSNIIMWPKIFSSICFVKINDLHLFKHIIPSLFIFLPTIAMTIYSVVDKTMIGILSPNPDYANGCYEKAYQLNSMALLFITVISTVFIPRNAYYYQSGEDEKLKNNLYFSINYVFFLALPFIFGFVVLSNNLSSWFLGEGYDDVPLMLIIMSSRFLFAGIGVVFGDQFFIIAGKEKYCIIASFSAAIINLALNFFIIPIYGGIGAAITTAVSEFTVTFVLTVFFAKQKILSIKRIILMSIKYIFSSFIMFVVIFFMQKNMPNAIWSFLVITIVGALLYFLVLFILRDSFFMNILHFPFSHLKEKNESDI